MKPYLALAPVVCVLFILLSGVASGADFKRCGSVSIPNFDRKVSFQVKVVSCAKARRVLRKADGLQLCFDGPFPKWEKVWWRAPSGINKLSLKQGSKVIKTNACGRA